MKKILIVGGCGYIGGYLTDVLSKEWNVTVYDSLLYEERFLKKINFIYGDIRDTEKLSKIINNYDIIIWLAALVGDGACQVDVNLTTEINFNSVKWLVDNYKGKIIFTSTCSIYGINNELIDENAKPNPLSAYASTKLDAETYIRQHSTNYLIFRLGTLFGVGDDHSRLRLDLVVNILVKKACAGEKLVVFGGEQWRPLLHVRDVSTAIRYGIIHNLNGLYNLAEGNYKITEIAEKISEIIPNTEVMYQELKFEDMRNYKVKTDAIKSLGWLPMFNLKYGIEELEKIFTENRIKNTNDPVYSNQAFVSNLYKKE